MDVACDANGHMVEAEGAPPGYDGIYLWCPLAVRIAAGGTPDEAMLAAATRWEANNALEVAMSRNLTAMALKLMDRFPDFYARTMRVEFMRSYINRRAESAAIRAKAEEAGLFMVLKSQAWDEASRYYRRTGHRFDASRSLVPWLMHAWGPNRWSYLDANINTQMWLERNAVSIQRAWRRYQLS